MSPRIVITTYGSFGDVHPYIAIALELKARGYHPAIAMSENYRPKIETEGIEFCPIRPNAAIDIEQDGEWIAVLKQSQRDSEYAICYVLMPHLRGTYRDLKQAVRGADLLITHHLSFAGSLVAQTTGIPWVSTVLSPISFMSAYDLPGKGDRSLSAYEQALKRVADDSLLRLARWQTRYWSAPMRQLRRELGLGPGLDPVFEGQHSPDLVLALFSQILADRQPDWPPQTQITGFPFYDRRASFESHLSPELLEFLAAGEPPIVFTLGSLFVWTPGNFYLEGAKAAAQLGYRSVLLMGQAAHTLSRHELPEGAIAVDYAPHSEIFPRAAAIAHHGGVGTTGQALRSGKPMLVVPFAHDQPDNAARVVRLGVGRTLALSESSAQQMASELKELLFNPSYAAKAAEIGQVMQGENGVGNAADAIVSYLNQIREQKGDE
ncbi:glycosyltransferase [Phormidium sp. CCY1219]|uniref:glycosyltransferase n=1 Tax=Phormidium sp. CCY1219 TaxID=2886104 RepID=UPI002D1E90F8|nr:glycosyltransferase [Phormidium sp. CCY1219]MEB3827058.1 glycosyltransferase [Phormidium sp. CCY1219]